MLLEYREQNITSDAEFSFMCKFKQKINKYIRSINHKATINTHTASILFRRTEPFSLFMRKIEKKITVLVTVHHILGAKLNQFRK